MKSIFLIGWILLLGGFANLSEYGVLELNFTNIQAAQGTIRVACYESQEQFSEEKAVRSANVNVQELGNAYLKIDELKYGTYVIAVFHDVNDNGKLDKNLLGIPVEPYAFAKPVKSKWRAPKFDEIKMDFFEPQKSINLELKKWKI